MVKGNKLIFLIVLIALVSCKIQKVKKELSRQWIVKSVELDGNHSDFGRSIFLVNIININSDGTCLFPMLIENRINANGNWNLNRSKDKYYLEVYNCDEDFFNDTYLVEIEPFGVSYKLKLSSTTKSIIISCVGNVMI